MWYLPLISWEPSPSDIFFHTLWKFTRPFHLWNEDCTNSNQKQQTLAVARFQKSSYPYRANEVGNYGSLRVHALGFHAWIEYCWSQDLCLVSPRSIQTPSLWNTSCNHSTYRVSVTFIIHIGSHIKRINQNYPKNSGGMDTWREGMHSIPRTFDWKGNKIVSSSGSGKFKTQSFQHHEGWFH